MTRRDPAWWQEWLTAVEQFRAEHGHAAIPQAYRTPDGRLLGSWITMRRREFRDGVLSRDDVALLETCGIDLRLSGIAARRAAVRPRQDERWDAALEELAAYRAEHGHVDVPQNYETSGGYRLGGWLSKCREQYRAGTLPAEREQDLVQRGVELDVLVAQWVSHLGDLAQFREAHGHSNVPAGYRCADGFMLGDWVVRARQAYQGGELLPNRAAALRALGVDLEQRQGDAAARRWTERVQALTDFREEHGHVQVPVSHVTADGVRLGSWLASCRSRWRDGTLPGPQVADLRRLGVDLNRYSPLARKSKEQLWTDWLEDLRSYRTIYGDTDMPPDYVTPHGRELGAWLQRCRAAARLGTLAPQRRQDLKKLKVRLPQRDLSRKQTPAARRARWQRGIAALRTFEAEHAHANPAATYIDPDGFRVGSWLSKRREEYRAGRLGERQIAELTTLGVQLAVQRGASTSRQEWGEGLWQDWLELLVAYRDTHGDVHVANSYITPDGRALGMWLSNCRRRFRAGTLPADRAQTLSQLGVDLQTNGRGGLDERWARWVKALIEYRAEYGDDPPGDYITPDGHKLGIWLAGTRVRYRQNKLPDHRAAELGALGVRLDTLHPPADSVEPAAPSG